MTSMARKKAHEPNVLVLSGGAGGAKLVNGLGYLINGPSLSVIVNTADDFNCHDLRVCPDLDTVMYALSGLQDEAKGWGIAGDTWHALEMIARYGEDTWFQLGDRDLATHIVRTALLNKGLSLSEVTKRLARSLGVSVNLAPMSDDTVSTWVTTSEGELPFQEYFVRRRTEPEVHGVRFEGIEAARPSPCLVEGLECADVIVIAPSNPVVSIAPILALRGIRDRLCGVDAVKVAVSPVIAGRAVKGPTLQMLRAFGIQATASAVAEQYSDFLSVFVLDRRDAKLASSIQDMGMEVVLTDTIMRTGQDKIRLAREILESVGA